MAKKQLSEEARQTRRDNLSVMNPEPPPEYTKKMGEAIKLITPQRPLYKPLDDPRNLEMMADRFRNYIDMCIEHDVRIGNLGAYFAMGINRARAMDILSGMYGQDLLDLLEWVDGVCAVYREGMMSEQKVHPATGIFWQKNYDGLKDNQEIIVRKDMYSDMPSEQQLREKYLGGAYGQDVVDLEEVED